MQKSRLHNSFIRLRLRLMTWLMTWLMACLTLSPVMASANPGWDISRLMQQLAQIQQAHVLFTETRYLSILDTPLSSSGELLYRAPDYLEQRTMKPQPQQLIVHHDQIELRQPGKVWQFSAQERPEIAQFIDSLRGTLSGDETLLAQQFTLQLQGNRSKWTLILIPRDTRLLHSITRIEINGDGSQLTRIAYRHSNGDHAVITLQPMDDSAP